MDEKKLKNILEAGLLVAGRSLNLAQLEALFQHDLEKPDRNQIRAALESLKQDYDGRGIELVEVASGFRLQSHESVSDWVANLFQEKTPRYSRALLETLVLIAYRQPITRAEIEDVRGVAVSTNIIKILQERQWVKVLGHREVPGKPALLGTTKEFLDYFNLKKLDELPALADIKDLDQFDELLAEEVGEVGEHGDAANDAGEHGEANEHRATDQPDDMSASTDATDNSDLNNGDAIDADANDEQGLAGKDNNGSQAVGDINPQQFGDVNLARTDIADGVNLNTDTVTSATADAENVESQFKGSENTDSQSVHSAVTDSEIVASDTGDSETMDSELSDSELVAEPLLLDTGPADNMLDLGVAETGDAAENIDANAEIDADPDIDADPNETLSGAELNLLRVISDFSEAHQQEIDARDEMEAVILSKDESDDADDDSVLDADLADLSQRVTDDTHTSDLPEPGDTLH